MKKYAHGKRKYNSITISCAMRTNLVCDDHDMFYVSAENMKAIKKIK